VVVAVIVVAMSLDDVVVAVFLSLFRFVHTYTYADIYVFYSRGTCTHDAYAYTVYASFSFGRLTVPLVDVVNFTHTLVSPEQQLPREAASQPEPSLKRSTYACEYLHRPRESSLCCCSMFLVTIILTF